MTNVVAATRSAYGSTNLSDGLTTGSTYRSRHVACRTFTLMKLLYLNGSGSTDNGTATVTYKAYVEYNGVSYGPFLWSGASTKALTTGTKAVSDALTVNIPKGATFWIRTYVSVAVLGEKWALTAGMTSTPNPPWGEGVSAGVDTASSTGVMTGGANNSALLTPLAIMNQDTSDQPSVIIFGDSIPTGGSDTQDALYNQGYLVRAFEGESPSGGLVPFTNVSLGGATIQSFVAGTEAPVRVTIPSSVLYRDAILSFGINDIVSNSRTGAQVIADLTTAIATLYGLGLRVWLCTLCPSTTSTDNYATTTNQTARTGCAVGGHRETVNNWVRRTAPTISGVQGIIDIADAVESARNSSFWKAGTGVTANIINGAWTASGDGTHPTSWASRFAAQIVPVSQFLVSSTSVQRVG